MAQQNTIIIGGGVAGIAMAHTLKWKLGYTDFEIYEKGPGVGGTWRVNTYPGCGSDVPIHLYSFSFNLNPGWTQALADQEEILRYVESTVDKFQLRQYFRLNCECLGARWSNERQQWDVTFLDGRTKKTFTRQCAILLSAVGGFSKPRDVRFPGMETFQGNIFHTAEWDHSFDYIGKRVAVVGNGCSAAQVVPSIASSVKKLTQYARSPQWYHERPNQAFTGFHKFCFKYLPLWQRYYRLKLFLDTDELSAVYSPEKVAQRVAVENQAKEYIYREAPEKYHSFIVPDFPLGCKRRIYDPGYLASLRRDNVELLPEGIKKITTTGIISENGKEEDFDAIVMATGFEVQSFLAPMEVIGKTNCTLQEQWDKDRGAQAYMGTFVHNFPNFAILFGPNTFPAFNSVIFSVEVQVAYIAQTLMKPILDGYATAVEAKEEAEDKFVANLDSVLATTVFAAGCSNWYINSAGRNAAAWPGLASGFWRATFFTKWQDFHLTGGSRLWLINRLVRKTRAASPITWLVVLASVAAVAWDWTNGGFELLRERLG
ncbi:FAD/NAD(P)-binding domain-containing protein [Phialemonium atrogriseum]|uniref:FAD/NAD(P)-binding domain-containing protein n=1 Tax=Phialemonium atrogriseum TaxID=1093897 RepID=A0AAJ0FKD8_9PEZI|nr:FAD/NAD(P)-binding domain-containing protein [Phialemonium atrogriseum]KAK1763980.1 FAD/NAD(P)-binding domain-containing protein [Phialemonium atrogriseum]